MIIVVGARPNIVKVAPLLPALERAGITAEVAFTGSRTYARPAGGAGDGADPDQAAGADDVSFYGITMPAPAWFLDVCEGANASATGAALVALETLLSTERPDAVLAVGDVDAALALAIAAAKLHIPVVHLEAGMRCGDPSLAEEVNRVLISRVTSLHLAVDEGAIANLTAEGIDPERVAFVGSMLAESVIRHAEAIRKLDAAAAFGVVRGGYALASFHREENLQSPERLQAVLDGLGLLELQVVLPDANGIRSAIETAALRVPAAVQVVDAVSYREMLALERDAAVVVTDSGGMQEEACMLGTPCVTVRRCTERASTLEVGANRLCDADADAVIIAVAEALEGPRRWLTPKRWDKAVSQRIVRALKRGVPALGA